MRRNRIISPRCAEFTTECSVGIFVHAAVAQGVGSLVYWRDCSVTVVQAFTVVLTGVGWCATIEALARLSFGASGLIGYVQRGYTG